MDDRDDFARRLRDASSRQGLEPKPTGSQAGLPGGAMGVGLRAGIEVVAALAVGVLVGLGLDRWLGTSPWLFLVFFLVGSAAGVLNVYRLFSPPRRLK